jgi:hypothetical protein
LSIEKTANLVVDLYQSGVGASSYSEVAATFVHSVNQDGVITIKGGVEVGPWAISPEIVDVDKMVQAVRAEVDGIALSSGNLGPLASDGTFANYGATYADGILTLNSVQYTRMPFTISDQVKNILRLDSNEIIDSVTSTKKCYFDRIHGLNVYAQNVDVEGYNYSELIAVCDENDSVLNEHYHKVHGTDLRIYYEVIDSQTKFPVSTYHKKDDVWSVTLAVQ